MQSMNAPLLSDAKDHSKSAEQGHVFNPISYKSTVTTAQLRKAFTKLALHVMEYKPALVDISGDLIKASRLCLKLDDRC